MKKFLLLAIAGLMVTGVTFADNGKKCKKSSSCCKKSSKKCCKKDSKEKEKEKETVKM